ncbi:class I SAM-dependent methyltransferase [Nocardioides solisilvae]|uniref:class I SAM-dependent methyltransferase n=1 Tax=Nocardioides solisilvae TaxID=1542435 RepID=UPI000D7442EE|nr:class I SAM-dependent methyltransferase [Nocardioides solisilvae]
MTETTTGTTTGTTTEELAQRLVGATTGALELFAVHLGRELGLYSCLAEQGPATAEELATRTGLDARYVREWAEQQAVAGMLDVTGLPEGPDPAVAGQPGHAPAFGLPVAGRRVLVDAEDPWHVGPLADLVAGIGGVLDRLPAAYRSGSGVPFEAYGEALRRGQAGINRPAFVHDLPDWLATLPELHAATEGDALRVADVACGEGWSTLGLAAALPTARVDGFDLDHASVEAARGHAVGSPVADRVAFHLVDAADPSALTGPYDLVTVFEALHDMARPVEALAAIRGALAPDGVLLVADERVADRFKPDAGDVERLMYGWSVTHCLPAALATRPSAALGTVLRSDRVGELAVEAGFGSIEVLPIEHDFFRFYLLRP